MDYNKLSKKELIELVREKTKVSNSNEATEALRNVVKKWKQENFCVLIMDTAGKIIHSEVVFLGSLNCSTVHPREIFRLAIEKSANSIVVGHNHPSGEMTLSREDMAITKRLLECSKILGIDLLDHVIFSETKSYSMKAEGLM